MYGSARSVGQAESSSGRSPRLPRSPRLGRRGEAGDRRSRGDIVGGGGMGVGGGGGKTLSMENIQSLNAAYAASGPLYMSDHHHERDHHASTSSVYPKATMTLGRSTNRASYSGRTTMGSSPNINMMEPGSSASHHHYRDRDRDSDVTMHLHSLQHQGGGGGGGGGGGVTGSGGGASSPLLRQAMRGSSGGADSPLLDFQSQLRELQRENDLLRQELDVKDNQLGSSMNSIKNFWSPELKKERVLRKDEAGRTGVLREQMRVHQDENQSLDPRRAKHLQMTIQALQDELRTQRDLNQLLQQESRAASGAASPDRLPPGVEPTEENFQRLQMEHDRQAKELFLLRKTLEEMELRIGSQKQTLSSRDESIKKLLEMLQSKGLGEGDGGGGGLRTSTRRSMDAEDQLGQLEVLLDQREKENQHLREELHRRNQLSTDPTKTKALQTVIDMKDTKISSLERNIRDLEDEIQTLKTNGLLHPNGAEADDFKHSQADLYSKSQSRFMKNKIDQLKQELSKKESELLALQTQLETLTNQNSDSKQHIEVLKESLTAKEQRANILQTEVDALRLRLEEKESFLNKKSKQLQEVTEEKGTLSGEIHDMKDMLDVKERKVNVLQKKIENLQEQLRDKEKQLGSLRERVKSLQTDSSNTDTALTTLEEALSEKERIIERLKEQRERDDREKLDEVENFKRENKELKDKLASLQSQLTNKESSLIDLKEQASSLSSEGLKKDSRLKSLELAVEQKTEECSKLESQLQKALEVDDPSRRAPEVSERVKALEKEVAQHKEESGKSQAEVERLLGLLRDLEAERADKDVRLTELERQAKLPNLKGPQPTQKKDGLPDGAPPPQLHQGGARETAERIRELERQLKDSMNTSAHREALWAQEEQARNAAQGQLEELMAALDKTRQELDITKQRLSTTQSSLAERDGHLNNMRQERRKQLEEILEMKQQALLAAISEKDANIALLELSGSKKKKSQEEVMALKREKDRLMHQLKQQQTQSRMKLIADNYDDGHHPPHPHPHHPPHHPGHPGHHRGPPRGPAQPAVNHRPSPDQGTPSAVLPPSPPPNPSPPSSLPQMPPPRLNPPFHAHPQATHYQWVIAYARVMPPTTLHDTMLAHSPAVPQPEPKPPNASAVVWHGVVWHWCPVPVNSSCASASGVISCVTGIPAWLGVGSPALSHHVTSRHSPRQTPQGTTGPDSAKCLHPQGPDSFQCLLSLTACRP
ncbi:ERC protein 2 [Engraulis encrasicolus]|uniref:ERC protein 2 n=1 Tax=Engraulis encrasicolus TaxID=184585 RepID=UPI002FD33320